MSEAASSLGRALASYAVAAVMAVATGHYLGRRLRRRRIIYGRELPHVATAVPGPRSRALIDRLAAHECPAITARRARRADALGVADTDPIVWDAAVGAVVRDVDGNVFIDATSGFGVATCGHSSARVCAAARAQLARPLLHAMGDAFPDAMRIELLEALAAFFPAGDDGSPALDRAILGCSGADAVQAALKTAALASGRCGVLAFSGGYHGLAHGALAVSDYKADAFRAPFAAQLGEHVRYAPFGALPLPPLAAAGIGAVLVEPIQGRGGVREAPPGWLEALRAHCDAEGALLIYDEVYSGFGRTGEWFAYQALAAATDRKPAADAVGGGAAAAPRNRAAPTPDLICLGKAMGGGFPISACLGTRKAMSAWGASKGEALHTQTFLGNPLGCACALGALRELRHLDAPALARRKGRTLRAALAGAGFEPAAVRGRGLMLAVSVPNPLRAMTGLLQRGVIALPCGDGPDFAMALIPPLTATDEQLRAIARALADAVRE